MLKLFAFLLPPLGLAAGIGAGIFLLEESGPSETHAHHSEEGSEQSEGQDPSGTQQYVKLNNQFVVPIIQKDMVTSVIVLSIGLELKSGDSETVYSREPKLRDGFLQVLFDHSNMGGFDGRFTQTSKMDTLRRALLKVAKDTIGESVSEVLITDLARQQM